MVFSPDFLRQTMPAWQDNKYAMEIRKLNSLRAIAALVVVISHYSNLTNWFGGYPGHGAGQLGVMLFFLISGFLMAYLYLDQPASRAATSRFFVARIARVLPLFIAVVCVSYLLQRLGVTGIFYDISNTGNILSHLLMLSGTSVLWTIPPEMQFYAVFAGFWLVWQRSKQAAACVLALAGGAIILLGMPNPMVKIAGLLVDTKIIMSLPTFMVGIAAGHLYARHGVCKKFAHGAFALCLLALPLVYPKIFLLLSGRELDAWRDLGVLGFLAALFAIIVFLVPDDSRWLANPAGDFIGKISYSLYLLHLPVFALMSMFLQPSKTSPGLLLPLYLGAALAVAYASYRLLEYPLRVWIRARLMPADRSHPGAAKIA
jgi:peptidoglycan/LPS O-acetylase OafA/YrhL